MTIDLEPSLQIMLASLAEKSGKTPEQLVHEMLIQQTLAKAPAQHPPDWEQRLLALGKPCGVSLPDEALSSEGLYDE